MSGDLEASAIEDHLVRLGSLCPWRIRRLAEAESTNDEIRNMAAEGVEEGSVVFAESQTRGRGRRGTQWFAAPGRNLLFSVLLIPPVPQRLWTRLTPLAALSVCRAIEDASSLRPDIKWPNDIEIAGRKICGILAETHSIPGDRPFAVIGIGLNVNGKDSDLPEPLRDSATCLEAAAGHAFDRNALAARILHSIETLYPTAVMGFSEVLDAIRARSPLLGWAVSVETQGKKLTGIAEGLGPEGELLLRTGDGRLHHLHQAHNLRRFPG